MSTSFLVAIVAGANRDAGTGITRAQFPRLYHIRHRRSQTDSEVEVPGHIYAAPQTDECRSVLADDPMIGDPRSLMNLRWVFRLESESCLLTL